MQKIRIIMQKLGDQTIKRAKKIIQQEILSDERETEAVSNELRDNMTKKGKKL